MSTTTITAAHLSKPAYIYIRQSTLAQVRQHQESAERQYALKDKAVGMGWPLSSIRVLDGDQGMSAVQSVGAETNLLFFSRFERAFSSSFFFF